MIKLKNFLAVSTISMLAIGCSDPDKADPGLTDGSNGSAVGSKAPPSPMGYRVCVEAKHPDSETIVAAKHAIDMNPDNKPLLPPAKPKMGVSTQDIQMFGATLTGRRWKNGSTLHVKFITPGPDPDFLVFKEKVKKYAVEWAKYANLKLSFDPHANPEIRISFAKDNTYWSYMGTDSSLKPAQASMNLGFVNASVKEEDYQMLILHEFGHAIGMIHEHSSPNASIPWKTEKVYEDYKAWYGWDKSMVDAQVFFKYSHAQTNHTATAYDSKSIMLYAIPKEHVTDASYAVDDNKVLSSVDKTFIAKEYPNIP